MLGRVGASTRSGRCSLRRPHQTRPTRTQFGKSSGPPPKGYLGDLRRASIQLHSKEQLQKKKEKKDDGAEEEVKQQSRPPFQPTLVGYARFLHESKLVWECLEQAVASSSDPSLVPLKDNGLERSAAAQEDIDWLVANKGATHPEHKPEGPGATYVELLQRLAADDVPSFMCHFYNFTFAHTAGGRMIGKAVSNAILDGAELSFYKYEGDPSAMADALKEKIEAAAQTWSEEERKRSVAQTPQTFEYSGKLLRCITLESDDDELLGGGGAGQGGEKEMAVAA